MARLTLTAAVLLILLGLGFFVGTGATHRTSLIPVFFGLPLLLLGFVARSDTWRMHAMHLAAMLGLLGIVGALWRPIGAWMRGGQLALDAKVLEQASMAAICAVFVALCVKSFVDARIRRRRADG
jgi:hypothetical protein